jgi:rhodanese-related sulfurtransferase
VPIITKCKLGGRSARAQMQLNMLGFKNVINLSGGITDYKGETV